MLVKVRFSHFKNPLLGNPAYDFTRMIIFGCDPDVRHEIEETIFDFYMQKLTAYMGERDEKSNFMAEQVPHS